MDQPMKLLVTTGDLRHHLTPGFHHLLDEVAKLVNLIVWHDPGDIIEIINYLGIKPDFILINEYGETNAPCIRNLAALDIPCAVALHDLHYRINERKEAMKREKVQHIFALYRDAFYGWYSEFSQQLHWLPHHYNPRIFCDYGLNKDIDYLLMGAMHQVIYPLRHRILQRMQDKPGFIYHPHPGYRDFYEDEEALVGRNFAREINRAKIFFTCDSKYRYPIAKYYEVLACNTLLLASASKELADLGFQPGLHFIEINEFDFEEKAEYYLHHERERLQIARQGCRMVQARHTTAIRAAQMVAVMEQIINRRSKTAIAGLIDN